MSIAVTFNGTVHNIPEAREVGWAALTNYLVDLANAQVAGGPQTANLRIALTTPVTVISTDYTVVTKLTSPAAVAVNLPAGTNEKLVLIVDGTGDASTNNITITPNGAETINGAANFVIRDDRMGVLMQYSSTGTNWFVVGAYQQEVLTETSANQGANRVLNKDFDDATTFIVDSGDTTKKLTFSLGSQLAGTTTTLTSTSDAARNIALPNVSDTIVARTSIDTGTERLKNKDLDDETTNIVDTADVSKKINFEPGGQTASTVTTIATTSTTSKTLTLPDITDTVVTKTSSDLTTGRLQNKDLSDDNCQFVDNADTSKAVGVSLGGATASTKTTLAFAQSSNRTLTFPDITDSVLTRGSVDQGVDALQNKDFRSGGGGACKFVDGGDPTKTLSTDLSPVNTGVDSILQFDNPLDATFIFPTTSQRLVGTTSTNTLTNKDYDGGTASNSLRMTLPKNTTSNLTALTRKEGTVVYDTDLDKPFYDNGTSLLPFGSAGGSGELNNITNPSAADAITGWTASGAGITVARTTTASELPLGDIIESAILITPVSSTDYVYTRFTMPESLKGKKLKLTWFQRYLSSYASGDLKIEVYQNSASNYSGSYTEFALSTDSSGTSAIPASNGSYTTTFDADSSDYYEVRIVRTAGTSALSITNVICGPGTQPQGAVVGPWISWTPTGSWVSNTTYTGRYRQVGTSGEFQVKATTSGAPTSASLTITLPTGLTVDTTNILVSASGELTVGTCQANDSVDAYPGSTYYASSTSVGAFYDDPAEASNRTALKPITQAAPFTFGAADSVVMSFSLPIAEWAGSGTVNLAQNDVEYASVGGTWDADSSVTVYGPAGSPIGGSLSSARAKTITWQTPIQATDRIQVWFSEDMISWFPWLVCDLNGTAAMSTNTAASAYPDSGVILEKGATAYQTIVNFRRYAAVANYDSPTVNWPSSNAYWVATKSKTGQAVGFGLASSTSAGLVNPYTAGSGVIYAGTYTPTLTNGANVASSTPYLATYQRIGPQVTVQVLIDIDPTAAANTATVLGISLPISSNLANIYDLVGNIVGQAVSGTAMQPGTIYANTGNDRAEITFNCTDLATRTYTGQFTYRII